LESPCCSVIGHEGVSLRIFMPFMCHARTGPADFATVSSMTRFKIPLSESCLRRIAQCRADIESTSRQMMAAHWRLGVNLPADLFFCSHRSKSFRIDETHNETLTRCCVEKFESELRNQRGASAFAHRWMARGMGGPDDARLDRFGSAVAHSIISTRFDFPTTHPADGTSWVPRAFAAAV
jgi:hypothetical protein